VSSNTLKANQVVGILLIAILSGVMSAFFAFGLEAGKPLEELAASMGTNSLYVSNPSLIFI
jgi:L-rhamnose-H+ transport protein